MVETSRKASEIENLCFVLGSFDDLPGPFAGSGSGVSILFPWGSLLRAVAQPGASELERLRQLLTPGAAVEVVTAIDSGADEAELARLGLAGFTPEAMARAWRELGWKASLTPLPDDHAYQTTWWRRIRQRTSRTAWRLSATPD